MAIIRPFTALRPQPQLAKQVASRPYDVMNSAEAKLEAQGNHHSFLHVTRSEIDLDAAIDVHSQEVYDRARENLDAFMKRDILFREGKDCYYIYRLVMNGREQTGLVCLSSLADYDNGIIKKHELTRPEKEQDRIQHMITIGAQTGNVFLAYRDNPGVTSIIEQWTTGKAPVYDLLADDGIRHSVWVINDSDTNDRITALFASEVPCTYIADGHHRAASAAKARQLLTGDKAGGTDFFLTTIFPSSHLQILDYNRVVKDLNGLSSADFIKKLGKDFTVKLVGEEPVRPAVPHEFGMYLADNWYRLQARPGSFSEDPIGVLDVTILQKNVLDRILGIKDPRTDERVDFVGGMRGLDGLQKRVDAGSMQVAFSLYPVTMEQLFAIADSGQIMPPKSTWFEPKLRDGLLTHLLGPEEQ